ncbi:hypothetical protein E2C01_083352 [Portunus trituberculatus]|uniref:Uncharacterized protein n=1 Tax=Portunus trituberculatus TaxID=210409 RepID=A0A5B7J1J0_PORTR|nr:hypothetical protein [Portunus trituberculatus]
MKATVYHVNQTKGRKNPLSINVCVFRLHMPAVFLTRYFNLQKGEEKVSVAGKGRGSGHGGVVKSGASGAK